MKQPLISVIIPTFNSASLINRAIGSVLDQTFQDFELIIVDDGSTDNTEKVVGEFQKKDGRIIYKRIPHSGGAAKPKNIGIDVSQGKFIATLDADDEWFPKKLEKQLGLFKSTSKDNLGFTGCLARHIYEKDGVNFIFKIPKYKNVLRYTLARDYMGSGSSMMYKREVFDKVGGFDERLRVGQDAEMRIRLAKCFDFDFVNEPLFAYHLNDKSISNTLNVKEKMRSVDYIIEKHKNLYKKYPKSYSDRLRFNGTSYMLSGEVRLARRCFWESTRAYYLNWRSYLFFLLSFLGPGVYKKLTLIKTRF